MEVGDESNEQPTNPFSKHKDLFFGSREAAEPFVQGCKLYENRRIALFNLQTCLKDGFAGCLFIVTQILFLLSNTIYGYVFPVQ